ncbi:heparinase II/III family protein [Cohnella sp. GbtcB17]|uniref:heparinase II/III domain-containing protein n=1 Tax=Cohnella sp. GbtcB17 TaxID=2824762 RepID=UPI001C2FD70E|nr:heparinase II/III family protein [Cohnella sp. GbtcB17]
MLADRYELSSVKAALLPPDRITPFPKAEDRPSWESLLPDTRSRWIALAERYADYDWPALKVEHYRAYWKSGELDTRSRAVFERRSVLGILAIAECIEDKGRFLDQVINGIFVVCEETTWVPPLHRLHTKENLQECMPDASDHLVELVTSTTSDLLLWIRYTMQSRLDAISPRICRRIADEVRTRLLIPYMKRDDYWWMGFKEGVRVNNWNPWCNSSALMGFLLLEEDPDRRAEAVYKIMRSLDAFVGTYSPDGCCDEGPGYWGPSGGGLYVALELLAAATGGTIDVFDEPLIRDIGNYIYKAHIHGRYFVDFADGDVKPLIGGAVMYRYGKATKDLRLQNLGASLPEGEPVIHIWFELYAQLYALFQERERLESAARAPYVRDAWLPSAQVMTARQREGSEEGLFLAAKGGHNFESHNHNDVGSFMAFVDGRPLFVDLGTEEYTAQTFGPDRYSLWYLQSQYHNLPTVRGVLQRSGAEYRAKDAIYETEDANDDGVSRLSLDIADAYPAEAGIRVWRRTFTLDRAERPQIEIADRFELDNETSDLFYSLMTPCEPLPAADGTIRLEYAPGRAAVLAFDRDHLEAVVEPISTMASRLIRNWGERMYRIVLREKRPTRSGSRTIRIYREEDKEGNEADGNG